MAPPTYSDLGKAARDVFSSGYHFGLFKLDVKSKTSTGVELATGGVSNQDTGKVFGTVETKYKLKDYGITLTEKWNTDNMITGDITLSDKLIKGLSIGYSCTFTPNTGVRTGKLKNTYKHENVSATADVDLSLSALPLVNASAVFGYQGWFGGYQFTYNAQRNKLTKNNVSFGYAASDFTIHSVVESGREFSASVYHKVRPGLEGAINMSWSSGHTLTQFGIGTKYNLDDDACIRAKVNTQLQIGLAYQQKLRDGVTASLSTNIDGKNFGSGGHKIGFALDLQA